MKAQSADRPIVLRSLFARKSNSESTACQLEPRENRQELNGLRA